MDANPIRDVVKGVIKDWRQESSKFGQEEILEIWRGAAGKKLARHSKPTSFKASRLIVNVDSSGYLYELTLQRQRIMKHLEKKFKRRPLKELQFRIGQI